MTPEARVLAQGFYTPSGRLELADAGADPVPPSLAVLPRNLRRGLSGLTRSVLSAAGAALKQVPLEAPVPAVFASRYGEIQTAVELMRRAQQHDESSPARFRHSVQNTCLGLLSLARGDTAANTALSAGEQTLAMAWLEGFMLLAEGAPHVLVTVADEAVPEELGENPLGGGGALAWLIGPAEEGGSEAAPRLSRPTRAAEPGAVPAQPLDLALALYRRIQDREGGLVDLGGSPGWGWVATLHPGVVPEATS